MAMANFLINARQHYAFDFSMKKVRVLCSTDGEWSVMTKHDMGYYAGRMFPTSTLAISPEAKTYDECKNAFKTMLIRRDFDNVSVFCNE